MLINVVDVNERPVGVADNYSTSFIDRLIVQANGLLGNDSDVDGDGLSVLLVSGPNVGSLELRSDGSFTYTPQPNFVGIASFTYRVTDGLLNSDDVTVSILVTVPNNLPGGGGSGGGGQEAAIAAMGVEMAMAVPAAAEVAAEGLVAVVRRRRDCRATGASCSRCCWPRGRDTVIGNATSPTATQVPGVVPAIQRLDDAKQENENFKLVLSEETYEIKSRGVESTSIQRSLTNDRRYQRIEHGDARLLVFSNNRIDFEQSQSSADFKEIVFQTVLSTGLVIWVLQGAQLLATILATTPAWIQLDPIAILPKSDSYDEEEPEDGATIFDNSRSSKI